MKVLFLVNLPAPYRRLFFSELGKKCDLTVIYERASARDRNKKWAEEKNGNYKEIFLKGKKIGDDNSLSLEIIKYLKKGKYDRIVVGMYSTFTAMIAITYLQIKQIPFYLSTDGGFVSEESNIKYHIKHHFIGAASHWLSTGANATDYLVHYGANRNKVSVYPFTSLTKDDLNSAKRYLATDKKKLRNKLGMTEEKILLSVGRFTYEGGYGKGYDTLLKVAERLDNTIGIYIVGDEPTEEFIQWKEQKNLKYVHFIGFKEKKELALFYAAADAFILLTKGDVWGLVINEAMSFALPIITTLQCNAGTELVRNGENGYLVNAGDVDATERAINSVFASPKQILKMSKKSLENIQIYSIENMAETHANLFWRG